MEPAHIAISVVGLIMLIGAMYAHRESIIKSISRQTGAFEIKEVSNFSKGKVTKKSYYILIEYSFFGIINKFSYKELDCGYGDCYWQTIHYNDISEAHEKVDELKAEFETKKIKKIWDGRVEKTIGYSYASKNKIPNFGKYIPPPPPITKQTITSNYGKSIIDDEI